MARFWAGRRDRRTGARRAGADRRPGRRAAEGLRDRVETSIGVKLDDIKLPVAPIAPVAPAMAQDAPLPPPVLNAPPALPAPTAPVEDGSATVRWTGANGDVQRRVVTVDATPADLAQLAQAYQAPEVEERRCGAGSDYTLNEVGSDGKLRKIICTDRIEAQAEQAAEMAMNHAAFAQQTKVSALASAKASIAMARVTIQNEPSLSAEDRAEALAELDEAIAEIEAEGLD